MSKTKNDVLIKELMQKVEEQKASLGPREKVAWETNGIFKFDSEVSGNFFNLNTVTDSETLAKALGFLILQEEGFLRACNRFGITSKYKWGGYTVEEWEKDFQTRIKVIQYDKKKKQLDETKKKLAALVSEEARTEMELEDIKKLLAS